MATAGDLSRAERKNLRAVYQGYYPTPGLMAFLWSDAMRRMTSGVLWAVMQARHSFAAGVLLLTSEQARVRSANKMMAEDSASGARDLLRLLQSASARP